MTTRQLGLFDDPRPPVPRDPNLTDRERKRLYPKCLAVLERLRKGPATNVELIPITYRFSARIWDLRARGVVIDTDEDRNSGMSTYTLLHEPEGLA